MSLSTNRYHILLHFNNSIMPLIPAPYSLTTSSSITRSPISIDIAIHLIARSSAKVHNHYFCHTQSQWLSLISHNLHIWLLVTIKSTWLHKPYFMSKVITCIKQDIPNSKSAPNSFTAVLYLSSIVVNYIWKRKINLHFRYSLLTFFFPCVTLVNNIWCGNYSIRKCIALIIYFIHCPCIMLWACWMTTVIRKFQYDFRHCIVIKCTHET